MNKNSLSTLLTGTALAVTMGFSSASIAHDHKNELAEAVNSDTRNAEFRTRDEFRHPHETLEFFGVKPNMTVVEIWPGGGWYTEILAPYLENNGKLYAAHFPDNTDREYYQRSRQAFVQMLDEHSEFSAIELTSFAPAKDHEIAPAGSADMVLTFRNLHNWYMQDGTDALQHAFTNFYTALKPGGILGVVDHRLPEERNDSDAEDSGYMKESWAVKYAEAAGFELVESSEINANPKDTADHPRGVWTLPPSLALGEADRERYLQIGESDRFTLKFRKPSEN